MNTPRVLLVDPSSESRDVLETLLAARGVATCSTGQWSTGIELARRHRPACVVLDMDAAGSSGGRRELSVAREFAQALTTEESSLVVLGTFRREGKVEGDGFQGEIVAKPYHYAPLLRKIEAVLGEHSDAPR